MSSGFPPRVCPAPAIYRSRTTVAGFIREHQTRPGPDIDDFTRIDTNVEPEFRPMLRKTFRPSATISSIRGLLHRRRLSAMPEQRCFSHATSNESIRGSSVSLKYVLDTGPVRCFVIAIFARRNA